MHGVVWWLGWLGCLFLPVVFINKWYPHSPETASSTETHIMVNSHPKLGILAKVKMCQNATHNHQYTTKYANSFEYVKRMDQINTLTNFVATQFTTGLV